MTTTTSPEGGLTLHRWLAVLAVGSLWACAEPSGTTPGTSSLDEHLPRSLVTHWGEARIDQAVPAPEPSPRAELRFDGAGRVDFDWRVVDGVADVRIEDGMLIGRTTTDAPVIALELTPAGRDALPDDDALWSVELRVRASSGSRAGVHPLRQPGPPMPVVVARADAWPLSSAIVAGDEAKTYSVVLDKVFTLEMPLAERNIRTLAVRPTNEAGATFTIESVRLVFRKERLASITSGPGWHGLGEVFREAVVTRTPEVVALPARLSEASWLDVSVGTIATPPPAFRVWVVADNAPDSASPVVAAEIAVDAPEQWRSVRVDLSPWAGQSVELRLEATAEQPGTLAFWSATVRHPQLAIGDDAPDRPRSVIIFLTDTLRADHLEAWGHDRETAPTIARLAAEGARFDDAVAQATWTKVSVSSILTSLYPSTTGIADLNDRVSAGETTLAEVFRAAGYATFATSSVPFSGQLTNLHQGVETLYEFGARQSAEGFQSKSARGWVDAFLPWLERHRDVPTFALIHAMDPHSPFLPPAPYDALWSEPGASDQFAEWTQQLEPHIKSPLLRRFVAPSRQELAAAGVDAEAFVAQEKAWYDGSIRGMDAQLERLMAGVDDVGLGEHAVVAVVADHGEEFLDHGHHWHGRTVYGEVANVPMLVWGRGMPSGVVVEETVQTIDLMPTLIALAGLETPERAQGRDLLPLIRGEDAGRARPAFTEHRAGSDPEEHDSFAVIEDGWKLVWNPEPPNDKPTYELYDHRADPLDQKNVADAHPERVTELAIKLKDWQAWAAGQQLDPSEVESALSAEDLDRLRSLGYID